MSQQELNQQSDQAEERDRLLIIIEKLAFFNDFSSYEKKRITGMHASFESYHANDIIIGEGTAGTSFYILASGSARVTKKSSNETLAIFRPGELFGEMAFLTGMARTSSVIASEEVMAIRVDQELMKQLGVEIREKIKDHLIAKLVKNVADMTERYITTHS